jgi:SAM-dependent methyltransferase
MSATAAADSWAWALADWRIPPEILAAAPQDPWAFPTDLFERRADAALHSPPTPSGVRALEGLVNRGSVLDVGAGGGAAAFALRDRMTRLTAVDSSADALTGLRSRARAARVDAHTVEGSWPDVAGDVSVHDVVVCHHVVYNVPQIATFLAELDRHARKRVVVELTDRHPLANLNPLWLKFHGLVRPDRPTADDFMGVVAELGLTASAVRWETEADDGLDVAARARMARIRLCLPEEREGEVAHALAALGPPRTTRVTVWWDADRAGGR